jgi:hypothetical protein
MTNDSERTWNPAVAVKRIVRAPEWVLEREKITQRQWRIRKRKDLKALIAAMFNYRSGCAYCPNQNGEIGAVGRLLESMWDSHKEKNWPWRSNDPSSATRRTGRNDCNQSAMAGIAAAHG